MDIRYLALPLRDFIVSSRRASGERAAGIERYRVSAPKSYCCALQGAIVVRSKELKPTIVISSNGPVVAENDHFKEGGLMNANRGHSI